MSCLTNNAQIGDCVIEQRALGLEMSPLVLYFFGRNNVNYLHDSIIKSVYSFEGKGTKIGRQDEKALIQIMRGIYLDDARYSQTHIHEQAFALNERVVAFCVPNIMMAYNDQARNLEGLNNSQVGVGLFRNPIPILGTGVATGTRATGKNALEMKSFF